VSAICWGKKNKRTVLYETIITIATCCRLCLLWGCHGVGYHQEYGQDEACRDRSSNGCCRLCHNYLCYLAFLCSPLDPRRVARVQGEKQGTRIDRIRIHINGILRALLNV
jgi:hypothetical protein